MTHTDPTVADRLEQLHLDVLDFLGRIESLLQRAEPEFRKDENQSHKALARVVGETRRSVQDLELRMAIVAPMKAGKSTIVNALVGYDLLPSRAVAMTTLPTEIVLSQSAAHSEPTLQIDPRDLALFRAAIRRIADELQPTIGDSGFRERVTGRYPYLAQLLKKIQQDWLAEWDSTTFTGLTRIRGALEVFNDVTRLAANLPEPMHLAERLHKVPRVTAAQRWSRSGDTPAFGHLVLVDTPGPDEADNALTLSEVLRHQLDKCSVILVVLDFTKLNSTAAAQIKDAMEPALAVIRREQLFAVVNKVDQRRHGDMRPGELRDFVMHDLDLMDSGAADRVFELVAIRALQAVRCLDEIAAAESRQPGSFTPSSSQETRALYELVYTIEAEDMLANATAESARLLAERARIKSGLNDFLRQAIAVLRTQAGSRVLQNALRRTHADMLDFADEVHLRCSALQSDRESVASEIARLDDDLRLIGEIREELDSTADVADQLRHDVRKILQQTTRQSHRAVVNVAVRDEPNGLEGSVRLITQAIRPDQGTPDVDALEFESVADAQIFLHTLTRPVIEQVDAAIKEAQSQAAHMFTERINAEMGRHDIRLKPVLAAAHRRLKTAFNVKLDVPPAELSDDIEEWEAIPMRTEERMVEVLVERTLQRRTWYKLWLGWATYQAAEREHQRKSFYRIDLGDVKKRLKDDLDRKLKTMHAEFDTYLTSELSRHMENYYTQLNRYLQRYRDALAKSLKDREQKHDSLGEWAERIGRFHEELREEITHAEDFLDGLQPITAVHAKE